MEGPKGSDDERNARKNTDGFESDQRSTNNSLIVLWGVEGVRAQNVARSDFRVQNRRYTQFYEISNEQIRISRLTDMLLSIGGVGQPR